MTERERLFCEWYVSTGNATISAKKAGYSEKSARNQGYRLMKKDEIQIYIKEKIQKEAEDIPSNDEIKRFWADLMMNGETDAIKLSASDKLAKAKGMYRSDDWD